MAVSLILSVKLSLNFLTHHLFDLVHQQVFPLTMEVSLKETLMLSQAVLVILINLIAIQTNKLILLVMWIWKIRFVFGNTVSMV